MIIESQFKFATAFQTLSGTSAVNSTNVHDAGSAKLVFGGNSLRPPLLQFIAEWVSLGSGTATIRCQFVGATDVGLTTALEVIADTGTISVSDDGTAFGTGHLYAARLLALRGQKAAKRYYGVQFTQGGTTPVFQVKAFVVADGHTQKGMLPKAATP